MGLWSGGKAKDVDDRYEVGKIPSLMPVVALTERMQDGI